MTPPSKSGPARLVKRYAETYTGIALAAGGAHAADTIKNVALPQRDAMTWICVAAMLVGFGGLHTVW